MMSDEREDYEGLLPCSCADADDLCPYCGGLLTALGSLGRLLWYRCQDCGATINDSELEG